MIVGTRHCERQRSNPVNKPQNCGLFSGLQQSFDPRNDDVYVPC